MSRETQYLFDSRSRWRSETVHEVAFAIAGDRDIDRQCQRRVTARLAARDPLLGQTAILEYVELVKLGAVGGRSGVFNARSPQRRQAIHHAVLGGGTRDRRFAVAVKQF